MTVNQFQFGHTKEEIVLRRMQRTHDMTERKSSKMALLEWQPVTAALAHFGAFSSFYIYFALFNYSFLHSFELSLGQYGDQTRVLRSGLNTSFFNFFRRVWGACTQTYCLQ